MRTSWLGLEISLRALQAQQSAINTAGHNVANANTPGFSRQGVRMVSSMPLKGDPGMIGTGVEIDQMMRYRDTFLDNQYRQRRGESAAYGGWVRAYDQLEGIFLEPSESGLRAQMDRFWSAVQSLANSPSESGTRTEVVEAGQALVATIHEMAGQLEALQRSLDESFVAQINDLNQKLKDIAQLNQQIFVAQSQGQSPSDLMDKRDLLVDEVAGMVGGRVSVADNGQYRLLIAGRPVLQGGTVLQINLERDLSTGLHSASWDIDGSPVAFTEGELSAIQGARDELIPQYTAYLETWVRAFVGDTTNATPEYVGFNNQHRQGYYLDAAGNTQQGGDFFSVDWAAKGITFLKSLGVAVQPLEVAAAANDPVLAGDGINAQALLDKVLTNPDQVQDAALAQPLSPGGSSLEGYYQGLIANLGVASRHHRSAEETARLRENQAKNQQLSVSGVSIDEEMTYLIQYEHAYAAAARVMTTVDSMLETLVNRVGLVGR